MLLCKRISECHARRNQQATEFPRARLCRNRRSVSPAALVDGRRHIRPVEWRWDGMPPPEWVRYLSDTPAGNALCAFAGVLLFFVLLHLAHAVGRLHRRLAETLLVRL